MEKFLGSVFVQNNTVGDESYHFDSFDNIYLNCEKHGKGKIKFTNKHFLDAHKFFGTIDYIDQYQTFNFEIDEDCTKIERGTVTGVHKDHKEDPSIWKFGKDLHYYEKGRQTLYHE